MGGWLCLLPGANLLTGNRAENLARAIECLNNALAVWTAEAVPRYHDVAAGNLKRALAARRSLRTST